MEKLEKRKRHFNINNLSQEEAESLSNDIGAKVREICDKAVLEANKILNVYNMKAQMQIVIEGINEETPKAVEEIT